MKFVRRGFFWGVEGGMGTIILDNQNIGVES